MHAVLSILTLGSARISCAVVATAGALLLAGCGPATAPKPEAGKAAPHAGGEHASEGPHGGHLIELGKEEYHVELVHDDKAGEVTFYVLDGTAKIAVPIEAAEVVVNLKHDGKAEQFKIAAKPDAGESTGKSSRFFSADKELAGDLDAEGADAELVLTIGGKQFRGKLEHEDGKEGHADHK
ncbi:MAG: hypothetical protein C0483_10240 [Pirellula sp.]|nr:hypothetical protein [Pirellula sp.]